MTHTYVRFWHKADIGGSRLLPCSLTGQAIIDATLAVSCASHDPKDTQNLDLIAHNPCDIAALMNSSVYIVRNNTMTRFGWAVEDVVR